LQIACAEGAVYGPRRERTVPLSVSLLVCALSFHSRASGTGRRFLRFLSVAPSPTATSVTGSDRSCFPLWQHFSTTTY